MPHLNAIEFVEALRLEGNKWAQEICEALEFQDSPELERLQACEDELQEIVPEEKRPLEPSRMAEWITERLAILERIEEHLKDAGLDAKDADDAVLDLICALDL